jgi:hypothetical protein
MLMLAAACVVAIVALGVVRWFVERKVHPCIPFVFISLYYI